MARQLDRSASRRFRGFTLIEVVIAMAILAVALITISLSLRVSTQLDHAITIKHQASHLAWNAMQRVLSTYRDQGIAPHQESVEIYDERRYVIVTESSPTATSSLLRIRTSVLDDQRHQLAFYDAYVPPKREGGSQ